uniref:Arginase n=1 Tax=viral metagenome TaxID=1070528 RepID=A0A6C0JC81_9ZZZZ
MIKNILLFPHSGGQKLIGVRNTPYILKEIMKKERNNSFKFHDVKVNNSRNKIETLNINLRNLYEKNKEVEGRRINIGGDHSMAIGSIAYTLNKHPNAKVIWFDAHADINTHEESRTKNVHGMPLSFLSGLTERTSKASETEEYKFGFIKNKLDLKNLMYIGIRDLDEYEKKIIKDNNIQVIKVDEFNCTEIYPTYLKIEHFIKDDPFHISFDVDSIDPDIIPSTGTSVKSGLLKFQTQTIVRQLMRSKKLVNMDITELNISNDFSDEDNNKSLKNTLDIFFDIKIK